MPFPASTPPERPEPVHSRVVINRLKHKGISLVATKRDIKIPNGDMNGVAEGRDIPHHEHGAFCQPHGEKFLSIGVVRLTNPCDSRKTADWNVTQPALCHTSLRISMIVRHF
jgi:hypothetical protein